MGRVADDLNAAYHAKYDRVGARLVATVVSEEAARTTLRLDPRSAAAGGHDEEDAIIDADASMGWQSERKGP